MTRQGWKAHRLPEAKLNRRRELGLCYKCGDKYNLSHVCRNKSLQVMILEKKDGGNMENEEIVREEEEEISEDLFAATHMELSLNSTDGFGDNHTMKIRGKIQGRDTVLLIDSRASHNFISEELRKNLELPVDEISEYRVTV